ERAAPQALLHHRVDDVLEVTRLDQPNRHVRQLRDTLPAGLVAVDCAAVQGLVCPLGPLLVDLPERQVPPVTDRLLVVLREGGQRLPLRSIVAYRIEQLLALRRPSDRDPSPPRPPAVAGQPVNRSVAVW